MWQARVVLGNGARVVVVARISIISYLLYKASRFGKVVRPGNLRQLHRRSGRDYVVALAENMHGEVFAVCILKVERSMS